MAADFRPWKLVERRVYVAYVFWYSKRFIIVNEMDRELHVFIIAGPSRKDLRRRIHSKIYYSATSQTIFATGA